MFKWVENLPDFARSRKLLILLISCLLVVALAIGGTILTYFMDVDVSLIREAMYLITGSGGGGVAAQAIPDTVQAKNGAYRAPASEIPAPRPPAGQATTPKQDALPEVSDEDDPFAWMRGA